MDYNENKEKRGNNALKQWVTFTYLCLQNRTELFPTNSAIPETSPRNRRLSIGTLLPTINGI